jgi:hypothetical protein
MTCADKRPTASRSCMRRRVRRHCRTLRFVLSAWPKGEGRRALCALRPSELPSRKRGSHGVAWSSAMDRPLLTRRSEDPWATIQGECRQQSFRCSQAHSASLSARVRGCGSRAVGFRAPEGPQRKQRPPCGVTRRTPTPQDLQRRLNDSSRPCITPSLLSLIMAQGVEIIDRSRPDDVSVVRDAPAT